MDLYSSQIQPFLEFHDVGERPILQVSYYGKRIRIPNRWFISVFEEVVVFWCLKINLPIEFLLLFCFHEWLRALIVLDYVEVDELKADILVDIFFSGGLQIDIGILSGISSR